MKKTLLLGLSFVFVVSSFAHAQTIGTGTFSGTASNGATKYYSFLPLDSGQFTATLSWDNQSATLLMVLVCGSSNPITFGVAAGGLDRTARLESGIVGLNSCLLGVSTMDQSAAFRLNVQRSTDQLATVQTATLHGVQPFSDGPVDSRLRDQAEGTFTELKAQRR
jgi:hypothetical protein